MDNWCITGVMDSEWIPAVGRWTEELLRSRHKKGLEAELTRNLEDRTEFIKDYLREVDYMEKERF